MIRFRVEAEREDGLNLLTSLDEGEADDEDLDCGERIMDSLQEKLDAALISLSAPQTQGHDAQDGNAGLEDTLSVGRSSLEAIGTIDADVRGILRALKKGRKLYGSVDPKRLNAIVKKAEEKTAVAEKGATGVVLKKSRDAFLESADAVFDLIGGAKASTLRLRQIRERLVAGKASGTMDEVVLKEVREELEEEKGRFDPAEAQERLSVLGTWGCSAVFDCKKALEERELEITIIEEVVDESLRRDIVAGSEEGRGILASILNASRRVFLMLLSPVTFSLRVLRAVNEYGFFN